MCYDQACLAYLFFAVIVGFTILIVLCLRYRKKFLAENLQLSSETIWKIVAKRASELNLEKTEMLFGIWQDQSLTIQNIVIKNIKNEIIAQVEKRLGSREIKIFKDNEVYQVKYLFKKYKSAEISKLNIDSVLANYSHVNTFGKHTIKIPDQPLIISKRPIFNTLGIFDYYSNDKLVGTVQNISASRQVGRLCIFPANIPIYLKIFILVV